MNIPPDPARPHPRPTHLQLPRPLRWGFAIFHRVAPQRAVRWATDLFSRPRRRALTTRESESVESAEIIQLDIRGVRLHGWSFGRPEAPLVVGHHGWGGRGAQLAPWGPGLAEAGYRFVCYDAPAHGDSGGSATNLVEMTDTLVELDRTHGPILGLLTHSMGGMVAARASERLAGLRVVASIAPPGTMLPYLELFVEAFGAGPALERRMLDEIEARVGLGPADLDCEAMAPSTTIPYLLAYDRDDQDVPYLQARRWIDAWPGAISLETSGLGHRRILRDEAVRERVAEFLLEHLRSDNASQ